MFSRASKRHGHGYACVHACDTEGKKKMSTGALWHDSISWVVLFFSIVLSSHHVTSKGRPRVFHGRPFLCVLGYSLLCHAHVECHHAKSSLCFCSVLFFLSSCPVCVRARFPPPPLGSRLLHLSPSFSSSLGGRAPLHGALQRPVPGTVLHPARVRRSPPRGGRCRHRLPQGAFLHVSEAIYV